MSAEHHMRLCLYWGGEITRLDNGSICYDPPRANKFVTVRHRVRFDDISAKIYNLMQLDTSKFRLKLTLRIPMYTGNGYCTFFGLPFEDDDGVEVIYELKAQMPNYQPEIYIETEAIPDTGEGSMELDLNLSQQLTQLPDNPVDSTTFGCTSQSTPCTSARYENLEYGSSSQHVTQSRELVRRLIEIQEIILPNKSVVIDTRYNRVPINVDGASDSEPATDSDDNDVDRGNAGIGIVEDVTVPIDEAVVPNYVPPTSGVSSNIGDKPTFAVSNRSYVVFKNVQNDLNAELCLGMLFESKEELKRAVELWSRKCDREYSVYQSSRNAWLVKCKTARANDYCNWMLKGVYKSIYKMWQITKIVDMHICAKDSLLVEDITESSCCPATHRRIQRLPRNVPGQRRGDQCP